MRLALIAAVFVVLSGPSWAAVTAEDCRREAADTTKAAQTMTDLAYAIKQRDAGFEASVATGGLKNAIYKFEEARQKLIPAMEQYAQAIEDLAAQLRTCARR